MVMTIEERVSKLEGTYEHLATKADIERAKWQLGAFLIALISVFVGILNFLE